MIYEYAIKYGLLDAAKHANEAKEINEDINVVLNEIGFYFDGTHLVKTSV